ncbi:hypothetical protein SDC9_67340 [bioreactor metagenome]|uniref:Uncharacterized protein n=1 Tax=bioreactor metagenome TaxID=1076179 RepID=A0A644XXC0_9ZZZZ
MRARGRNFKVLDMRHDTIRVEFEAGSDQKKPLLAFLESMDGKDVSLELSKWTHKRSLDANAYFHVLCDKIARAVSAGNDETKRNLVLEYGTQKRTEDGSPSWFVIPKGDDPLSRSKYPKWFTGVMVNGKEADAYIEYKETHTLDTSEMAALIDGTISECKELGIETLPRAELERMMGQW